MSRSSFIYDGQHKVTLLACRAQFLPTVFPHTHACTRVLMKCRPRPASFRSRPQLVRSPRTVCASWMVASSAHQRSYPRFHPATHALAHLSSSSTQANHKIKWAPSYRARLPVFSFEVASALKAKGGIEKRGSSLRRAFCLHFNSICLARILAVATTPNVMQPMRTRLMRIAVPITCGRSEYLSNCDDRASR
jgi:hypothetical protein